MSSFDPQRQELLKRMWQGHERKFSDATPNLGPNFTNSSNPSKTLRHALSGGFDDELVAAVVPPVTVVLEGRSICHRISLHKHGSYQSFARALRQMFVDIIAVGDDDNNINSDSVFDLSNAVPGHLIAYEDMENDLLLVGDLNWKDFVRVAKRIRILPAKTKSGKQKDGELN